MTEFQEELQSLINKHSKENDSNTPDFILAEYLKNALDNFNSIIYAREKWYGRVPEFTNIPMYDETGNPPNATPTNTSICIGDDIGYHGDFHLINLQNNKLDD